MVKKWRMPYWVSSNGRRYIADTYHASRNPSRYIWEDPVDFQAMLTAAQWGSTRSTGVVIFTDENQKEYLFTVKDVLEMMPHIYAGRIKGTFGWKKQGTAIWNIFVAPAPDWPPRVLIGSSGGVADVSEKPDWITVEIRDYDNEE